MSARPHYTTWKPRQPRPAALPGRAEELLARAIVASRTWLEAHGWFPAAPFIHLALTIIASALFGIVLGLFCMALQW